MNSVSIKNPVTLESIAASIGALGVRMDGFESSLGSRMDSLESKLGTRIDGLGIRMDSLECQIDDLAISVKHEFDRVNLRLDEMDKHLIELKDELDYKTAGLQNQLDNVYTNYTMRTEHVKLDKRVQRLERVVK